MLWLALVNMQTEFGANWVPDNKTKDVVARQARSLFIEVVLDLCESVDKDKEIFLSKR